MDRRQFLAALGATASAGCTISIGDDGSSGSDTPTLTPAPTPTPQATSTPSPTPIPTATSTPESAPSPTPTDTLTPTATLTPTSTPTATPSPTPAPTPTPTATPEPVPEITDISLLTSWTDSGDFDTNAVDSIGEGGVATVGFVFDVPVHDGEVEVRAQVDVFDSSGSHVGTKEGIDNRLTGQQGVGSFEWSATFDSRAWQRGSYTARVLIQDRIGGKTSPEEKTDFEVVESLGSSEVEYVRHIGPETVTAGESFSWEVEVRNIVDRDSTLISPMSQNYEGQGWDEIDTVNLNIPGNNDEARFGDDWTLDGPGSYNYRLDDARDVRWSIEVE